MAPNSFVANSYLVRLRSRLRRLRVLCLFILSRRFFNVLLAIISSTNHVGAGILIGANSCATIGIALNIVGLVCNSRDDAPLGSLCNPDSRTPNVDARGTGLNAAGGAAAMELIGTLR